MARTAELTQAQYRQALRQYVNSVMERLDVRQQNLLNIVLSGEKFNWNTDRMTTASGIRRVNTFTNAVRDIGWILLKQAARDLKSKELPGTW